MENFRDFAKYNKYIKKNLLFRSATLATDNPISIYNFLDSKNINTIIDLRTKEEIKEYPYNELILEKFNYFNIAFDPHGVTKDFARRYIGLSGMDILYYFLINENKSNIKKVFNIILKNESGIVIHCTAGKDRTGLIAFLVSKLFNVSNDNILMDYLESRGDSDKSRLNIFHKTIDEHGGIIDYLISCGLSISNINSLIKKLKYDKKTND